MRLISGIAVAAVTAGLAVALAGPASADPAKDTHWASPAPANNWYNSGPVPANNWYSSSPDVKGTWTYTGYSYPGVEQCMAHGDSGVANGSWLRYDCRWSGNGFDLWAFVN